MNESGFVCLTHELSYGAGWSGACEKWAAANPGYDSRSAEPGDECFLALQDKVLKLARASYGLEEQ